MVINKVKVALASYLTLLLFNGCDTVSSSGEIKIETTRQQGDITVNSKPTNTENQKSDTETDGTDKKLIKGKLVDAPIANVSYQCGDKTDKTKMDGSFECKEFPVSFFIGKLKIGEIDKLPKDGLIYPQDLVGLERDDFSSKDVLKIAKFLQSLDDDGNISNVISIDDSVEEELKNIPDTKLLDLVESEIDEIISKVKKTPLPEEMVIAHLKKNTLTIPKDKVKGWPNHLAIGTVTDNSVSVNRYLIDGKVDSIFKYAGNGFGDRGKVITPSVTLRTIEQARNVEKVSNKPVMPVMVVYTANGSGGGVAPEDILNRDNLVKHMRNLIRLSVAMENQKDDKHPNPATIVLNADLFGEWQKSKNYGSFQEVYCGGSEDRSCEKFKKIDIRGALKEAIEQESGSLDDYALDKIKDSIDKEISNDIKGWVTSQNFIIKTFAPDIPFGWVINLWNPGSALWVHNYYKTPEDLWNKASKGVVDFVKWIGAYDNTPSRPDFLAFDKYERDGFGAAGKPYYAFGAKEWENYLTYVQQIAENLRTPAMLWQIPGGHMATYSENYDGEAHLCEEGESSGCFRHLDYGAFGGHSASGGTFFMGDSLIGKNLNEIREDVLDITLNSSVYHGASSVRMLLEQDKGYDWSQVGLKKALKSHVFAILWGGGETTGVAPISTNLTGGYEWLKRKVAKYESSGGLQLSGEVWKFDAVSKPTYIDRVDEDEIENQDEVKVEESPKSTIENNGKPVSVDESVLKNYPKYDPSKLSTYDEGSMVIGLDGKLYKCKKYPFSGWCKISAYAPGDSSGVWMNAWDRVSKNSGTSTTTTTTTTTPTETDSNTNTNSNSNDIPNSNSNSNSNSGSGMNNSSSTPTDSTESDKTDKTETQSNSNSNNNGSSTSSTTTTTTTTEPEEKVNSSSQSSTTVTTTTKENGSSYEKYSVDKILTYKAGTIVIGLDGGVYKCKPHPFSGWCKISAYAPGGSNGIWNNAWDKIADGGATKSESSNSNSDSQDNSSNSNKESATSNSNNTSSSNVDKDKGSSSSSGGNESVGTETQTQSNNNQGGEVTTSKPITQTTVSQDGTILNSLTTEDWDWFFPFRFGHPNSNGSSYNLGTEACSLLGLSGTVENNPACDIYTLEHFKEAIKIYNNYAKKSGLSQFLQEGSLEQQAEELASFLSNVSRETSGSWANAPVKPGGWIEFDNNINMKVWKGGLYWTEEVGHTTNPDGTIKEGPYTDFSSKYKPFPNRSYHGRGPIQLSWNYNYGYFSQWLYQNGLYPEVIKSEDALLKNPGLVNKDATIAFLSAIWFWMTPQGVKPSAHDVMLGKIEKVSSSSSDMGLPQRNDGGDVPLKRNGDSKELVTAYRLGTTINIINGGIECNRASSWHPGPPQRVSYFEAYIKYLNYRFGLNATELGVGYVADKKISESSDEVLKLGTCYSQKAYYGW